MKNYRAAVYTGAFMSPQAILKVDFAQCVDNPYQIKWWQMFDMECETRYCRFAENHGAIHIDFGSWSEFIMIWEVEE